MRAIYFLSFFFLIGNLYPSDLGQKDLAEDDFQTNFNIAKQHLSQRRINKALPYLRYLQKEFPNNANLKYLIGLCYAELEIVNPITVQLLEESAEKSSLDYDPNSLSEKRVPIYVYYYLCLAYAQNNMCEKAENAREKFVEVYPYDDPFYLKESMSWIKKCHEMNEQPELDTIPEFPDFVPYASDPKRELTEGGGLLTETIADSSREETGEENHMTIYPSHVVTKHVEYSTGFPLYGVQLGAFKEVVPVARFKDLKNVEAFMDKDGLIRYVVGHFGIYSQAESLLKVIKEKGYPDAFVVNTNNARKFADEVISIDNVNIKRTLKGKLEYRIQIGAFKEEVPQELASRYLEIEGIDELREGEITYLTVGNYATYDEAKAYQQGIKDMGISDAFVIALNNGKKISLQEAKDYGSK